MCLSMRTIRGTELRHYEGETAMRRLKVLVADDHELMLEGVRLALAQAQDEFEIVAVTTRGPQVLPLVARTQPDLVLLDLRMPGMDGLTCLELLRQRHPGVKAIVLSGVDAPDVIRSAFNRGAVAFVRKHVDPRDLPSVLRQALNGTVTHQTFGEPAETEAETAKDAGLSEREMSILRALGEGLSNKQIAKRHWLAEQTVKFHLTNIYRKLGVGTRTEAVHVAYRSGLLEAPLLEAASG
jgi:two-component system, NarL family, response regulator YdfI